MNAAFGIDHPLIAVRDLDGLRRRLISIGFNMTAVGKHPWGTNTSLAMFEGCLIEIMGIYDDTLLDEVPAGDFCFGRHIYDHLEDREGVALTALHSTDTVRDAARATEAGFTISGHLEFGRDVVLPDGRSGRTKTTLALMPDATWPRLSFFLCQQHRPELIYVPSWLKHPNTVYGIAAVIILAGDEDRPAVVEKLKHLYGTEKIMPGGFAFQTANGEIRVLSQEAIEADYGALPAATSETQEPCIVAMDLKYADEVTFETWLRKGDVSYTKATRLFQLSDPKDTGNTFFRFVPSGAPGL